MQLLKFILRNHGVSKKGNDYDLIQVSDGLQSFTLSLDPDCVSSFQELNLQEGDEFSALIKVGVRYGALVGTIVQVEEV